MRTNLLLLAAVLAGCSNGNGTASHSVVVDTDTAQEEAQYLADVDLIQSYTPQCQSTGQNPRVLLTGYGRFLSNFTNASGLIVSTLVPAAAYPYTTPPPDGGVDDPSNQVSVGSQTIQLPMTGAVDVCAMILPVYWGLAPALVMKEIDGFAPDLLVMMGIAADTQPMWIELGSVNQAQATPDGSNLLAPADGAPLIPEAPTGTTDPLLLSWNTVQQAAQTAITANAQVTSDAGVAFQDVLTGVLFAGFPRASNTYLCNNITFDLDYAMDNPGQSLTLLQPSTPQDGGPNGVVLSLANNYSNVPRVFVHWPSALTDSLLGAGANVLGAMIDAQLNALANGPAPTRGDNSMAQVTQ